MYNTEYCALQNFIPELCRHSSCLEIYAHIQEAYASVESQRDASLEIYVLYIPFRFYLRQDSDPDCAPLDGSYIAFNFLSTY